MRKIQDIIAGDTTPESVESDTSTTFNRRRVGGHDIYDITGSGQSIQPGLPSEPQPQPDPVLGSSITDIIPIGTLKSKNVVATYAGTGRISTAIPAGEWLIRLHQQDNETAGGSKLDEDEYMSYAKKWTVPADQKLYFKAGQTFLEYLIQPATAEVPDFTASWISIGSWVDQKGSGNWIIENELWAVDPRDNHAEATGSLIGFAMMIGETSSVDAGVGTGSTGGSGGVWTSGWVNTDGTTSFGDSATMTFTHTLNTTDLVFSFYVADDANGSNAYQVSTNRASSSYGYGLQVQNLTNTTFTVQVGNAGTAKANSNGQHSTDELIGKFCKIVAISGSGGGSGGTSGSGLSVPAVESIAQAKTFDGVNGIGGTLIHHNTINGFIAGSGYRDVFTPIQTGVKNSWTIFRVGASNGNVLSTFYRPWEDDITACQSDYNAGWGPCGAVIGFARAGNLGGYPIIPVMNSGVIGAFGSDSSASAHVVLERLASIPYTYSGQLLYNGGLAEPSSNTGTSLTTIDASSAVGSKVALLAIRVAPSSTVAASFFARRTEDDIQGYGGTTRGGWGVSSCMVNGIQANPAGPTITSGAYTSHGVNRGGYVYILTDTAGKFQAGAHTNSSVNLTLHSYVIPELHNTVIHDTAITGLVYPTYAYSNISTTEIDTGLGSKSIVYLKVECTNSGSSRSIYFRPKGDILTMSGDEPNWANCGATGVACAFGGTYNRGGYVMLLTDDTGKIEAMDCPNPDLTNVESGDKFRITLLASMTPS